MMKISPEEVRYVAHLARLNLDDKELETITSQIDTILNYVEKLDELDTRDVAPTTHAFSITNAFREDKVTESLDQQKALANSPRQKGEMFVVPRII